jgi:hypothetical protein
MFSCSFICLSFVGYFLIFNSNLGTDKTSLDFHVVITGALTCSGANIINYVVFALIYETQLSHKEFTGKFTDIYYLMLRTYVCKY